jgi:diadenosine tetraphosphate (Ap4A) HIT family hydrolase
MQAMTLLRCAGGSVELPALVLCDRADGGHLVVSPTREVWDRTALTPDELSAFSFLVAATSRAMLESLPQLEQGCINYWDAGNWALNEAADPGGLKSGPVHRRLHVHLFGRSRTARHPDWQWGEAPRFPAYAKRIEWASHFSPLTAEESRAVVARVTHILINSYGVKLP